MNYVKRLKMGGQMMQSLSFIRMQILLPGCRTLRILSWIYYCGMNLANYQIHLLQNLLFQCLVDFRVLCANNEGRYGVSNWNLRADGQFSQSDTISKPLVIHSNDYALGLHNGDDGVILGQKAYFAEEDGYREIALSRLPQHKIGYASTIHRSQGSEFTKVAVVLPPEDSQLLSRELLYVAISRAKENVFLIGSEASLRAAVNRTEKQNSGILDLMKHS